MGWVMLAVIGAATVLLLWRLGLPRLLWTTAGAVLMLGASGYALQGSPFAPASPARPSVSQIEVSPDIVALRGDMFGRFSEDAAYQTAADGMLRANVPSAAVKVTLGGINKLPRSIALWTQLGSVLVVHDGGNVSPAALFAFNRAMQLAPRHPGPPFFLGLGYLQAGRFDEARLWWARSLALCPAKAGYRAGVAERLALLDQFLAMSRQQGAQPPAP